MTDQTYRIIELKAERFKRLRAVTIRPDGSVVEINGQNGNGKTSVLDAIQAALGGRAASPDVPIRRGETTASTVVDLGEIVVRREWTAPADGDGPPRSTLTVTAKDGARYGSPQALLDALVGRLTFDPLAFMRLAPKQQADALREVAGLDLSGLDQQERALYEQRTGVGRALRDAQAAAKAAGEPEDPGPEPESMDPITEQIARASAGNGRRRDAERRVAEAERGLNRARNELAAAEDEARRAADELEKAPSHQDLDELRAEARRAQLAHADHAERRRQHEAAASARRHLRDVQAEHQQLEASIAGVRLARADAISAAAMPIAGLGIEGDTVTFDGLPLRQASSAQQLKVSCAIGMAANPKLRVLLVRDGSLLDAESMGALAQWAGENNVQVWIERVGEGRGVVIEDGEVRTPTSGAQT